MKHDSSVNSSPALARFLTLEKSSSGFPTQLCKIASSVLMSWMVLCQETTASQLARKASEPARGLALSSSRRRGPARTPTCRPRSPP